MHRLLPLLLLVACAKERPASPPELDEVSHALFRDWEDLAALQTHVVDAGDWLSDNVDSEEAWNGLQLTNLTNDDVHDVDFPADTKLANHRGIATAGFRSAHALEDHADLIAGGDQTYTDPGSFETYRRTILEGDAGEFRDGKGMIRTDNVILKKGAFGVEIPYTIRKDYRWVSDNAIVARGWASVPGCSDNGKNCVLQSWGVELFVRDGKGSLRLYEVWLEVVTQADGAIGEDAKIALIAKGNQDILEQTDEHLDEQ